MLCYINSGIFEVSIDDVQIVAMRQMYMLDSVICSSSYVSLPVRTKHMRVIRLCFILRDSSRT